MTANLDLSRVHLVGIGGAGMSGVARILLARGSTVSGSDAKDSRALLALRSMGAHIAVGHSADNLLVDGQLPTTVVTSFAAIPQDNPELVAAKDNGIPVIRRSDLLAALMTGSTQVLVAGTHGKTSTTSMAVVALQAAGMDPSFAIGGQLNKAGTNAHHGTGHCFVAEADESDASLLTYEPAIAVITNIEPDHLDFFKTAENYLKVFDDFVDLIPTGGYLVACLECPTTADVARRVQEQQRGIHVWGYGTQAACERYPDLAYTIVRDIEVGETSTAVVQVGEESVPVELQIPGEHMVLNAAAAITAGVAAGGDVAKLAAGVSDFGGVRRRFEYHGQARGVEVYDDYAHHPTEVHAVLTAARKKVEARGYGRVVVVFQPHLYSRTREFHSEFAEALSLADVAVVMDIFGAREQPMEGVTSQMITHAMTIPVAFEPNFSATAQVVVDATQAGDVVLTMGAGSVTMLADEILLLLGDEDA